MIAVQNTQIWEIRSDLDLIRVVDTTVTSSHRPGLCAVLS
jgi:hypothetical protein